MGTFQIPTCYILKIGFVVALVPYSWSFVFLWWPFCQTHYSTITSLDPICFLLWFSNFSLLHIYHGQLLLFQSIFKLNCIYSIGLFQIINSVQNKVISVAYLMFRIQKSALKETLQFKGCCFSLAPNLQYVLAENTSPSYMSHWYLKCCLNFDWTQNWDCSKSLYSFSPRQS